MKKKCFWLGLLLALPMLLSALELALTAPADNATVPLLNDKHKAFLAMPREERIAYFADAEKRKQLVKAGYWPRPVCFQWKSTDAPDETTYRVLVSETPDMSDALAVTGEKGQAKLYNLKIGWKYYWQVEAIAPGEKPVLSSVRSFVTETQAPRLLRFPNVPNVRDLGGRRTKDGLYVKQGLVFRTAGMNTNARRLPAKNDEELFRAHPEFRVILPLYCDILKKLQVDPESVPVMPCALKKKWTVFKTDKAELSAAELKQLDELKFVPETLFGFRGKVMTANKIDRVYIPKDGEELCTAVLMQEFEVPTDGIMQINSGGDWYWCVRVNGLLVYDKMAGNKKTPTTSNYGYFVPVRKGKNVIAVVLKSGSGNWMWGCGKRKGRDPVRAIAARIKEMRNAPVGWQKGKNRVASEGRAIFLDRYGVKSDIDLRTGGECWGMTGSPLGESVKWFHIPSAAYAGMFGKRGKTQFAKVFRVFLDEKNYPVIFHCIAGQDRTGAVAFILNGLLGVPEEELYLDWEATGFWNQNAGFFNHARLFNKLIAGFRKLPGKDLNEQIESYVLSCGFTRDDIEKFRAIMLEKR